MKKHENTILLFLFGLIFFVGGISAILFFASENIFTCTRVSGNIGTCQYIEKTIINTKTIDFQLANIKEARVKESSGGKRSYSVELYTTEGNPLTITGASSSSGSAEKYSYADKINKFLANTNQKNLNLVYDERLLKYIFGAIFVFAGVGMFLRGVFTLLKARVV